MSSTDRKFFNWVLFNQLAKILVVLVILGLGFQAFYVFWWSGPKLELDPDNSMQVSGSEAESETDPLQIFTDFTSGAWQFGESDWNFRILSASAASAIDELPSAERLGDPEFDDQAVINQFRELGVEPQPLGDGLEKWESEGLGFRLTLFTRDGVVQLMRTRLPVEQGISVIEAIPRSARDLEANPGLLPLIAESKQTAVRVNPEGQITSAIIQLEVEKQIDMRNYWEENGWRVIPAPEFSLVDPNQSSANSKFRCTKDGTAIDATFLTQEGDSQSLVILTLIASANRN